LYNANYYEDFKLSMYFTYTSAQNYTHSVAEQVRTGGVITYCRDFLRIIALTLRPLTEGKRNLSARRDITTEANTQDSTLRQRGFTRTLLAGVTAASHAGKVFAPFRTIREEAAAFGEAGHLGDYLRGISTEAGSMAETRHEGNYHRKVEDTAHNEGVSLRHLFVFIRLITLSLVRDYITGRFLKSKEELVIKSHICREIILDSTLH
jgi:hypothetical protein